MTNHKHSNRILSVAAVVLLVSLACSIGGLTFNGNAATLDVKLTEENLKMLVERAADASASVDDNSLLEHLTDIELHDGFMRLFGTQTVNSTPVDGSLDVSLGASNGMLQAEIIAVDFPGLDMNDPRVQQANETIARELTKIVNETSGEVTFQKAEVREDALYLTVQVKLQRTP